MRQSIRLGTMLIADGTRTPQSVPLATERYSPGWFSITKSTSAQLDRELEKAGWTFFYMAGEIRASGCGFDVQSRTGRAVHRLIDAVKHESCNCLEITEVKQGSFLGLPYTTLVAHARHIQKSHSFHSSLNPAYARSVPAARSPMPLSSKAVDVWEDEGGSPAEPLPVI
jgi:hypothetical protein